MISIVVATSLNKVIWKNNKLPWYYPEDLKNFKEITSWGTILMWRNTYYSIWRPLPNRRNVVLSESEINEEWVEVYHSIEDFFQNWISQDENVYVIGWESIYKQFLDKSDYLYLTLIKENYEGDTFFPDYKDKFEEIKRENKWDFDLLVLKRK